jgi:hypothetical protein
MIPMRLVETDRDDFDEPVVELWRDDEFVGMVFWDGDTAVVQIYADDDGDVKDLEVRELTRVLDIAESIVSPYAVGESADEGDEGEGDGWADEDPATVTLVEEFDGRARHRTEDGEGFFAWEDADALVRRCDQLDLAVLELEGFDMVAGHLEPLPEQRLFTTVDGSVPWPGFRAAANARAADALLDWDDRSGARVFAFVIGLPGGDSFVA